MLLNQYVRDVMAEVAKGLEAVPEVVKDTNYTVATDYDNAQIRFNIAPNGTMALTLPSGPIPEGSSLSFELYLKQKPKPKTAKKRKRVVYEDDENDE